MTWWLRRYLAFRVWRYTQVVNRSFKVQTCIGRYAIEWPCADAFASGDIFPSMSKWWAKFSETAHLSSFMRPTGQRSTVRRDYVMRVDKKNCRNQVDCGLKVVLVTENQKVNVTKCKFIMRTSGFCKSQSPSVHLIGSLNSHQSVIRYPIPHTPRDMS